VASSATARRPPWRPPSARAHDVPRRPRRLRR
jgi:hypothetical protein